MAIPKLMFGPVTLVAALTTPVDKLIGYTDTVPAPLATR
jgi:hypothetical protein